MIKNLKKVISTLAAVAILATSASAFAVSFPDVDESASYAGAVEALTTLGIVNGDDNGKFNPENTVTRAEFAKMVVEALGAGNEAASSADTKFVDAKGHWAAGYIEVGVAKEFINGYDETTFGPDDQVTYAQAVKMLVAAIGYETYASQQGGWPSGYLSYGSSLDIIAGVSGVTNDTALTRAQCAILIYNTLKAPICKIATWDQNYKGEWYPVLEEMDGEGKGWQTLLTTQHNAWVVKGRVDDVTVDAKNGDTVNFRVELAENFENEKVKAYYETVTVTVEDENGEEEEVTEDVVKGAKNVKAYVGESKAADMLFNFAEAIIQKDKDTSEYTIVSITPYGAVKTVEFAAKDIKEALEDGEIKVKKDNTTKTNDYKVSGADLYVNGLYVGEYNATNAAIAPLTDNNTGVVTLVNATELASTSTDDDYDYVMVTYYETGYVTAVDVDDEEAIIEVTAISENLENGDIVIDLEEDPTRKVTFIKDGAEISYEDVKKDDIVSIAYEWGGDWETDDIEVIVSDKVVAGTATGKNTAKNTVTVDGTVYDYADVTIDLGNSYNLYLDAFGCIVKAEVNATNKTLGIVVGNYPSSAENGEYKIKLITADGTVETYPVANETEYEKFTTVATSTANAKNAVVEYKIDANGNIKWKANVTVDPGEETADAEFTKELSMLGGYQISETATKVVALGSYFTDGKVAAMTVDQLEDEAKYDVFVTNDTDGVYGLVVITGDLAALNPKSTLAVVSATGTTTTVNDESVYAVTVAVNGEEDVEVYFDDTQYAGADTDDDEDDKYLAEGDVIMYTVGTEGYVEAGDFEVIYTPAASADAMYTAVFADATSFTANTGSAVITDSDTDGTYTLAINGEDDDEEVEIYYGPVYTATENSLRIFKSQTDGVSSFTDVKTFSIGNANVYSYNYNKIAEEGLRVSVAGLTQDMSFFKVEGQTSFDWTTRTEKKVNPRVALVRVVDNVVTDVVYYRAK